MGVLVWRTLFGVTLVWGGLFWAGLGIFWLQIPSLREIQQDCFYTRWHKVYLCSQSRLYVSYGQVPPYFWDLLLMAEDGEFYQHKGFSWFEWRRAIEEGFSGKPLRGASTITQQLAKNLYLDGRRTLWRKLIEWIVARRMEQVFTKRQILEKYINVVEWGPQVYGLKSAARFYFGIPISQLTPEQSLKLISILPNPRWGPVCLPEPSFRCPKRWFYRWNRLRMLAFQRGMAWGGDPSLQPTPQGLPWDSWDGDPGGSSRPF